MVRSLSVTAWIIAAMAMGVIWNFGGWQCVVAAIVWAVCMEFREALKREAAR